LQLVEDEVRKSSRKSPGAKGSSWPSITADESTMNPSLSS
jgi:hypothetical protein